MNRDRGIMKGYPTPVEAAERLSAAVRARDGRVAAELERVRLAHWSRRVIDWFGKDDA